LSKRAGVRHYLDVPPIPKKETHIYGKRPVEEIYISEKRPVK